MERGDLISIIELLLSSSGYIIKSFKEHYHIKEIIKELKGVNDSNAKFIKNLPDLVVIDKLLKECSFLSLLKIKDDKFYISKEKLELIKKQEDIIFVSAVPKGYYFYAEHANNLKIKKTGYYNLELLRPIRDVFPRINENNLITSAELIYVISS